MHYWAIYSQKALVKILYSQYKQSVHKNRHTNIKYLFIFIPRSFIDHEKIGWKENTL